MTIKLIATDLDQTLLKNDKTFSSERLNAIIEVCKEHGVLFVVASGNGWHKIEERMANVMTKGMYLAGDNANHIKKDGESIRICAVNRETILAIGNYLQSQQGYSLGISCLKKTYMTTNDQKIIQEYAKYNTEIVHLESLEDLPMDEQIVKLAVWVERPVSEMKEMVNYIKAHYADVDAVTSGDKWMDVFLAGTGKGSGIAFFQERYQITPEETIVFGDSLNDLTMMQQAKYSVMMKNSDKDLLPFGKFQIGTNEEEAVLSVLEELVAHQFNPDYLQKYQIN